MSNTANFVPFADREATFERSEGAIVNHLNLPVGTDLERIELNIPRLESLTRWAGAKQLVLASADLGNDLLRHYDVDHLGGGVAGAKGVRKDPDETHHLHTYVDDENPMTTLFGIKGASVQSNSRLAAYKADQLVLHVDTRGLTQKVAENKKAVRGALDERVWSRVLDAEVRRGVTGAAMDRYRGRTEATGFIDPIISLALYYDVYDYVANEGSPVWAGVAIGLKGLQLAIGTGRIVNGEAGWRDYNWSTQIFTRARTDRLIATAVSAQFGSKAFRHKK